jgi:outer membrane protein
MIRQFLLGCAAAGAFAATPALAQDEDGGDDDRLIISVGGGVQFTPAFPGSDELKLQPLFTGGRRREGEPLPGRAPDDGFGFSLTGRGGRVEIGPLLQFQAERKQEDVGAAVGDVDFAFEPGIFVNLNVSESLRIRAEGRRGFEGHEGYLGDIGIDTFLRPNDRTVVSFGPRVRLADEEYMRTYYGITPAVSAATGIPAFAPDGGVRAIGVMGGITHEFTRNFGIYGYAGYDRLIGDAQESPIVQQFGSENQFSAGIALFFNFRMRNPF